jgi:hypothetical protein
MACAMKRQQLCCFGDLGRHKGATPQVGRSRSRAWAPVAGGRARMTPYWMQSELLCHQTKPFDVHGRATLCRTGGSSPPTGAISRAAARPPAAQRGPDERDTSDRRSRWAVACRGCNRHGRPAHSKRRRPGRRAAQDRRRPRRGLSPLPHAHWERPRRALVRLRVGQGAAHAQVRELATAALGPVFDDPARGKFRSGDLCEIVAGRTVHGAERNTGRLCDPAQRHIVPSRGSIWERQASVLSLAMVEAFGCSG